MKSPMSDVDSLEAVLNELESVLEVERQALRVLDREVIFQAAEDKLRLDAALRALPAPAGHSPALREQLERIQSAARTNQILLAHARSCVQGMLEMLTGQGTLPAVRGGSPPPRPVAVNLRG